MFESSPIPLGLEKYIDHFAVLIDRSLQVMLLTIDSDKDFIDEEGVAITSVLSL